MPVLFVDDKRVMRVHSCSMIRPDVMQLRQFYASPLGRVVRGALSDAVRSHWPQLGGDVTLGLGYANPMMRPYLREEQAGECLLIPLMPAAQGAVFWPSYRENRTLLVDEEQLPVRDHLANRVLLVHALEHAESQARLLHEMWRVLTPGGRMLVVVPNRRSIWTSFANTPFSYGKPYSVSQLRDALCAAQFTIIDSHTALYVWPTQRRSLQRISSVVLKAARFIFPMLGGVIVMEVEKQIYASAKEPLRNAKTRNVYAAVTKPAMTREGR